MYKNETIRKIAAAGMLLLFVLGAIPEQILHNVITGHKHEYVKSGAIKNFHAAKNNFQCNWPEQFATSPFTGEPCFRLERSVPVYTSYINHYTFNYYSTELFFSSLRGPPFRV